mgnify:CR=1 FL=1|tara:strand:- start:1434 stop:1706 length:273 start_codon:yes stop_codon:yes gene_type:complete
MRHLTVFRPNGGTQEFDLPSEWTCVKAAYHIAYELGMPVFEMPWCLGLQELETPQGKHLKWMGSSRLVGEMPDDGECFLSQIPWRATQWN